MRRSGGSLGANSSRIVAVILLLLAPSAWAQWRTELHNFRSLTIADRDLLAGRLDVGRDVTVAGVLSIPLEAEGRIPAVILLHGAAGVLPYVTEWQQELASMGVAAFLIDSFTPRGIITTIADQDQLARLNAAVDAYRALALLSQHPRIDPNRISC